MQVYSDASDLGGYYSIGSLLIRKSKVRPFEKKWRRMLSNFGLTHFHMTDCNANQGEFRNLGDDRDRCARQAISILIEYGEKASIFCVKKSDFNEIILPSGLMPNPFALGVWYMLFDTRHWADDNDPNARISYIFESGDDDQSDADTLLKSIAQDPIRSQNSRYNGHAFLPKIGSLPTQAADILAWQGAKSRNRNDRGFHGLRGDFNEIVSKLTVTDGYHDRAWLQRLVDISNKHGGRFGSELAGIAFKYNKENAKQMNLRVSEIVSRVG